MKIKLKSTNKIYYVEYANNQYEVTVSTTPTNVDVYMVKIINGNITDYNMSKVIEKIMRSKDLPIDFQ